MSAQVDKLLEELQENNYTRLTNNPQLVLDMVKLVRLAEDVFAKEKPFTRPAVYLATALERFRWDVSGRARNERRSKTKAMTDKELAAIDDRATEEGFSPVQHIDEWLSVRALIRSLQGDVESRTRLLDQAKGRLVRQEQLWSLINFQGGLIDDLIKSLENYDPKLVDQQLAKYRSDRGILESNATKIEEANVNTIWTKV